jgi:predicted nucleic acid-binding protein
VNFADTNWLEALYFDAKNKEQQARCATAARFMRQHGGLLGISHVVYLEARNVFSRNTGESEPEEWRLLLSDLNGRLYLDAMNWDVLRREAFALFARYSARATIGTLDMAILASAKLSGATRLLSFDETIRAVAEAERIAVFPALTLVGRTLLSQLRQAR